MFSRIGPVQAAVLLISGILLGQRFHVPTLFCLLLAGSFFASAVYFARRGRMYELDQPVKKASRLCLALAILAVGMLRVSFEQKTPPDRSIEKFLNTESVQFEGRVTAPPLETTSKTSLRLEVWNDPRMDGGPDNGKVLLVFYRDPGVKFHYGDLLSVRGKLTRPSDSGNGFSYRTYLERDGISVMINNPSVEHLPGFSGSRFLAFTYHLREVLVTQVFRLFPKPENALIAGILLGDESKITSDIERDFQKTGTAHIIAISGANFTVLAWLLLSIIRQLIPQWWAPLTLLPFLAFYTILVGGSPAVVRAAIMCGLSIIASCLGRQGQGINSLAFSAGVMCLVKPAMIVDVGFQLSVMATLGILLFSDPLRNITRGILSKLFPSWPEQTMITVLNVLNDLCLLSLSAQVFTMWISAQAFGRISLISIPANILIAPFQSVIMLGGFTALLLSFLFYPLGAALAWLVWAAPALTIRIVQLCAKVPWASIYIDLGPGHAWVIIGLILAGFYFRNQLTGLVRRRDFRPYAALLASFAAVMVWMAALDRLDHRTKIEFTQSRSSMMMRILSESGRSFVIGDGMTNYAAQTALEKTIFPIRSVPAAAWLDFQDEWMRTAFMQSGSADGLPLLYTEDVSLGGSEYPEKLMDGMAFSADGIRLRAEKTFLGHRAWILENDHLRLLFPNGVPPERIFSAKRIRPETISLAVLGIRDDAALWQDAGTGIPLFDRSEHNTTTLFLDGESISYD